MTAEEARAFLGRHVDSVNRHDASALADDYTEDAVMESPIFGIVHGRQAIEASYRAGFQSWPDSLQQTLSLLVDGDRACDIGIFGGTHVHDLMGLPGTGKPFKMHIAFLYQLRDDKIAHERRIYDFTTVLVQLGIMKVKPSKG